MINEEKVFAKELFKIQKITEEEIMFNNGKKITYYHPQECCEHVYADFPAIDDLAWEYEFYEPVVYQAVEGFGFRFGNTGQMVSVPCYDIQNGYYDASLSVRFHGFDITIEQMEMEHILE